METPRRLALDESSFDAVLEVSLDTNITSIFLKELSESAIKPVVELANRTTCVLTSGPAWRRIRPENEEVPDEPLFAVKGCSSLACPATSWTGVDLQFHSDSSELLGNATFDDDDETTLIVQSMLTMQTYDVVLSPQLASNLQKHVEELKPDPAKCISTLPTAPINALHARAGSTWSTLPEWMASLFLTWASLKLRVHLPISIATPLDKEGEGQPRPLFLESATVSHVANKDPRSPNTVSRQCTFRLHDSAGGCVCQHYTTKKQTDTHFRTCIKVEFCGCKHEHQNACPFHTHQNGSTSSSQNPLLDRICTHGLCVGMLCQHKNEETGSFRSVTVFDVKLPEDTFLKTFASACVEITERPQNVSTHEIQDAVQAVFEHSLRKDHEELALHGIDIVKRDQIVEAIVRSGNYFFGGPDGKKSGKMTLRKRKQQERSPYEADTDRVPSWMREYLPTHAHLFPTYKYTD
jgi:hypothetical protein